MNKSRLMVPFAFVLLWSVPLAGQINVPEINIPQTSTADKDALFRKYMSEESADTDRRARSPAVDSAEQVLKVETITANIEYVRSQEAQYRHTQKVFEWQLTSSHIIFWVVIVLVLFGIVLSWLQFTKSGKQLTDAKGDPVSSVLKFSFKEGIQITSPVLGVLILVISLAFFYLYLVEVYQIRVVK